MARSSTTAAAGNVLAVKHGAQSLRIMAERVPEIVAAWTDPDTGLQLTTPADTAAIQATASAFARLCEIERYFEDMEARTGHGIIDSRGRPRGAARLYASMYREVMAGLKALGATPAGRAEMAGGIAALSNARRAADAAQASLTAKYRVQQ